ncbi:MAG: DegT/DnrJ/EryC1/StrS family aminotransferase [Thermodesulfobacteriota bacterium]|nr:DegT/DnrJ/EryC1/StrS family aminotransferase [Thermodesulfobacteriota bacterium]
MRIARTLAPAAAPIYLQDIISGIKGLLSGQQELRRFESELKGYFGVDYCFLVSSGKAALTLILQALKEIYPDRNEVLIPAFTCYSVPSAIVRAGLKPELWDIDPRTMDFDYAMLPTALTKLNELNNPITPAHDPSRLLAIVPTHLFGVSADIERLRGLLNEHEISIIEDAAQIMGAERNGKKLGTLGDVGFFSLGRGKALSTVEGGIILTRKKEFAQNISDRLSKVHGYGVVELMKLFLKAIALALFLRPTLYWVPKSLAFLRLGETIFDPGFKIKRMSAFQAGLAKNWKSKLENFGAVRSDYSKRWSKLMKPSKDYDLLTIDHELNANPLRFPVIIHNDSRRKNILKESNDRGLGIMPTYPDSINGIRDLANGFEGQHFPAAKKRAKELITLPIHPFVTKKDMSKIAGLISGTTE